MSAEGERLKDEGSKLQVVAAGASAGLISRFVVAPLDVVKIRLQLQTHSLSDPRSIQNLHGGPVYKGTIPTMRHIFAHEGITGLWKGNVPAELMYVCYGAVQFTAYRAATLLLQECAGGPGVVPPGVESFVSGAAAGAAATAVTYPLDLLRTRFAAQGNVDRVYQNLRHAIVDIARDEGPRGYFRGIGPAMIQIAPFMGTFFAVYESLRAPLDRLSKKLTGIPHIPLGGGDAAAGMLAAVAAKTVVFPLDLVRKRIQVQGPTRARYVHKNIPAYEGSVVRTLSTILHKEGVRGLYRGLTVSLLKAAPASAVTVWTYERVLHLLMQMNLPEKKEETKNATVQVATAVRGSVITKGVSNAVVSNSGVLHDGTDDTG